MRPIPGHRSGARGRSLARIFAYPFTAAAALLAQPAHAAAPAGNPDAWIAFAVVAGAVALGVSAALWAHAERRAAQDLRRKLRNADARMRAATGARDALIAAGRESVVVWSSEGAAPRVYGDADRLVDACLSGPDAVKLAEALDALSDRGTAFALSARDEKGHAIALRGRAVGGMAAVWAQEWPATGALAPDFRAMLDALPVPVWLRDGVRALVWGNRAFLDATGAPDNAAAVAAQVSLEKSERDLAAAARNEGRVLESRRFSVVAGQRRTLALTHVPLENDCVVGSAIDVTELSNAEARLQQHIDAHADTLDKLATAVAIFDSQTALAFYNGAFVRLWDLPEAWLDTHPTHEEFLDRLRETRRLPEQRDYQAWKRQRLALFTQAAEYLPESLWYLPGGKALRVVAQPHPFGGLTFLYEDVTEKLALESSYNTLIKVQSATLDTLSEGVAVFGPDARLKLHNAAFARLWSLDAADLAGEPHVQTVAQACMAKYGDEPVWHRLVAIIAAGADRGRDWGEIERSDKSMLAVSLAPLPDGAMLVTFADVTDRFRIETALRDRAEALEAADRLKSDFVHHASFLFRDPLNAVHGFATLLADGHAGPLAPKQQEYVRDILSASKNLADVTSDILDLALIDSGAMRLDLARVNLHDLLSRVCAPLRKHAESLDIAFRLECAADIGEIVADGRRLRQVVFNLLSNAFKYTPREGAIVLGAAIAGGDVLIYVSDTGPGIAPEMKANVFDRFAAKGRGGQGPGAGLGLALVRQFVELHGGWVEIESAPDRGTLVRIHLPRRAGEQDPPAPAKTQAGQR